MPPEKDYVLGTHDEEIARLGLQHRVWRSRAVDAWRRAGFAEGQTLVDLGCGPGWATLDLAEIVGPGGRVIAIDRSRRFLDTLQAAADERGLGQIETLELDLSDRELPALEAHGIWSRWVYAFVPRPRTLLERAARALRPGGAMAMQEYVDYRAWRLSPRTPEFEVFVTEVMASWRENGGEPDVGLDLPRWLMELEFAVEPLRAIGEITRPGDAWWPWPQAFVDTGITRLVELGRIPRSQGRAIRAAYDAAIGRPGAFQVLPTVVEIIARRP